MNDLDSYNKHISGIYQIRNMLNGRIYIGSTINILSRYNAHKSLLKRRIHSNKFLQNDFNKCGEESFIFEVLEQIQDSELLLDKEQQWIDKFYDNQNNCYNLCKKANGTIGYKHTKFSIEKMSKAKLGESNPSKRNDVKEKLSKLMLGKNNHQYGKKRTWVGLIGKQLCSKPVAQYTKDGMLIQTWESASEASRKLKIERSNINKCCRNLVSSCGGFIWKFV